MFSSNLNFLKYGHRIDMHISLFYYFKITYIFDDFSIILGEKYRDAYRIDKPVSRYASYRGISLSSQP